jgi:acetoin:2,6-dichlorophenolindophenol oxidoreductase subunit beta
MARIITGAEALKEAMIEEMERDDRVYFMGEDVGLIGGGIGQHGGLFERFGEKRVIDTPISETFIIGGAVGAAITGLRPVVELMFADFVGCAMDELYNKVGKWRFMHGSLFTVPLVVRLPEGAVGGAGPEHSQCPESLFWSAPGLYVAIPSSPADAKGLLKSAIRSDNPVLFFEHKLLYYMTGEVPDGDHLIPLGKADIKREGTDVTIIAWSMQVNKALEAAELLAKDGISVEVVDPRGIRPLDKETILASVEKTGRVVFAHEPAKTGGPASEVAAIIAEEALSSLAAPIKRVAAPDVPIPQSIFLESFYVPSTTDIVNAVREIM